jgi:hypothetical protein
VVPRGAVFREKMNFSLEQLFRKASALCGSLAFPWFVFSKVIVNLVYQVDSPLSTLTNRVLKLAGAKAKTMAKSMINIKAVKPSSEVHNNREKDYDYVFSDLTPKNEKWESDSISSMQKKIESYCKATSKRKLQKNATPIREAVVLIKPDHTMEDLVDLADKIKDEFGVECFQIHIHRDEGKSRDDLNLHAHMVFRWQDMETGKTMRVNKLGMSQLQTLVANALGMERGELKENSNRERLEPTEYKRQQEELRQKELQEQNDVLEQKKNEVRARIAKLTEGGNEAHTRTISEKSENPSTSLEEFAEWPENDLNSAIKHLESRVHEINEQVQKQP